MRPLLLAVKAEKSHSMYENVEESENIMNRSIVIGLTQPNIPISRMPSRPSVGGTALGTQRNSSNSGSVPGSAETQRMLGDLLLISSKQINYRKQEVELANAGGLPFQTIQVQSSAPPQRASTSQQQRPTSGMRVPSASRGRLGRARLHPLERPKTPSANVSAFDGLSLVCLCFFFIG